MRQILSAILILLLFVAQRSTAAGGLTAEETQLLYSEDSVQLRMIVHLPDKRVPRKDIFLLTPRLVNGNDSIDLPSIGLYGRTPYYYLVRSGLYMFQNQSDIMLRANDTRPGDVFLYARSVSTLGREWLEGAEVRFSAVHYSCCGDILSDDAWQVLEAHNTIKAPATATRVVHETFEKKGSMHIDFILDSIRVRRDYHENWRELDRLDNDLDTILGDYRYVIDSVTIHGYASPEGPYKHNVWLSQHRTEALKRYIVSNHEIDSTLIHTRYTPEDWAGLRRFVEASSLPHRDEILKVIDDTIGRPDPDLRLRYIRRRYVEDFAVIFRDCLPYLRHSDYTISYTYSNSYAVPDMVATAAATAAYQQQRMPDEPFNVLLTRRPLVAIKTNLLLDAALWPNVEMELPFGRHDRWSIMAEWGSPWYVWHHNSRAYEILNVGLEMRRWLGRCPGCHPTLTGNFLGLYAAAGKYDIEWKSVGDQGEYASFGFSAGHSWLLSKSWNLELSGSVGVLFGPQRHYNGEFDDTHLIWKRFGSLFYVGPTQMKLSLVWLLPRKMFGMDKGQRPLHPNTPITWIANEADNGTTAKSTKAAKSTKDTKTKAAKPTTPAKAAKPTTPATTAPVAVPKGSPTGNDTTTTVPTGSHKIVPAYKPKARKTVPAAPWATAKPDVKPAAPTSYMPQQAPTMKGALPDRALNALSPHRPMTAPPLPATASSKAANATPLPSTGPELSQYRKEATHE